MEYNSDLKNNYSPFETLKETSQLFKRKVVSLEIYKG